MIAFIPVNFPSVTVLDRYGLRAGVTLGMGLTVVGIWLRCLMNVDMTYAVVGQTIMAIGQPFLYNAPSKISAVWFPENERLVATSIGAYANIVGVALGCFVPSIFFSDSDLDHSDEARSHFFNMNVVLAGISTLVLIPSVIFIHNKPGYKSSQE